MTERAATSSCRPSFETVIAVSEFESARNLDDAVQATAADRVRRSDLTESWTVDIEDGVAGPV
jgi:hypothetical protein